MLIPDRLRRVRELLDERGSVRIDELVADLGVSAWTVRRDLAELEQRGELRRTHGGAFLERATPGAVRPDLPGRVDELGQTVPPSPADRAAHVAAGDESTRRAKERIAAAAARRIPEGSTIMVLGGTTTSALVPLLATRRLTVVTNGIEIAHLLRDAPEVSLVVLGGVLHREQMTLIGPLSEASMSDLHVDLIVAGAYGVHPRIGITGSKIVQAGYHHGMLEHTDGLLVLADASKLGRRGATVLAATHDVTTLITDDAAPPDVVSGLLDAGVDVDVV